MTQPYILYGMSASLYTGKVRAYLIHHGIPFIERGAGHPVFMKEILPQTGRWIIPVIVTPDGTVLQDGTAIIDHFEQAQTGIYSVIPSDPTLKAVSYLFELFGGEGLLRPAMHYRWNFDADNLDFLKVNFAEAFPHGLSPDQQSAMFDQSSGRMRRAGTAFGVSPETVETIERTYSECLSLLNDHFRNTQFLLGSTASLGDYGLMNGLYAHLARDPHPALIMKREAPHVFSWTERMNRPHASSSELKTPSTDLLTETLKPLMQFIADDFLPELAAHTHYTNDWLADHMPPSNEPMERSIGMASFSWRGHDTQTAVMPYRHWLLQRLTDHYDGCSDEDQASIRHLFDETGVSPFLDSRLSRRVERSGLREVWA